MDNISFPVHSIGDLAPHSWVRFTDGEVGVIHDKVDQPGYRKACVEVPGARYPIRIVAYDVQVEHIPSTNCAKPHSP